MKPWATGDGVVDPRACGESICIVSIPASGPPSDSAAGLQAAGEVTASPGWIGAISHQRPKDWNLGVARACHRDFLFAYTDSSYTRRSTAPRDAWGAAPRRRGPRTAAGGDELISTSLEHLHICHTHSPLSTCIHLPLRTHRRVSLCGASSNPRAEITTVRRIALAADRQCGGRMPRRRHLSGVLAHCWRLPIHLPTSCPNISRRQPAHRAPSPAFAATTSAFRWQAWHKLQHPQPTRTPLMAPHQPPARTRPLSLSARAPRSSSACSKN